MDRPKREFLVYAPQSTENLCSCRIFWFTDGN